jgi:hypothetical protein
VLVRLNPLSLPLFTPHPSASRSYNAWLRCAWPSR